MQLVVRLALAALFLSTLTPHALAQKSDFCVGFSEGWKSLKGDLAMAPMCPIPTVSSIGITAYHEGVKAGVSKARSTGGEPPLRATPGRDHESFCDGYADGWRSIKGTDNLMPVCPRPPITPIGSTPYKEGLRVGMQKGRVS